MSYDSKDIAHWERSSKDPPYTWQVVLVRPKTRTKQKDHLLVDLYFTSSDTTKKETSLYDQVFRDLSNEWFNRTPIIFCRYILNGSIEHPWSFLIFLVYKSFLYLILSVYFEWFNRVPMIFPDLPSIKVIFVFGYVLSR